MSGAARMPRVGSTGRADASLLGPLMEFAAAVVRADEIDPVTTELVRVRCATYHDCHT